MKEIPLSRGKVALVDDQDFERLNAFKWSAAKRKSKFYAVTHVKRKAIYMHRFILGLTESKIEADHKNGNGLDNQRSNLRIANRFTNNANKSPHSNSTSKFLGVSWHRTGKKWIANITKDGKLIYLGLHVKEEDAAKAYNEAAIRLHGEFANLNKFTA